MLDPAIRSLASLIGLLGLASGAAASSLPGPVVFCELGVDQVPAAPAAGGMLPADFGDGARLVRLEDDGSTTTLTPGFAGACDPDVSFDGQRILFAGKKEAQDPWNIWEMEADGSGVRQITDVPLGARDPIYLSTFYTITSSEPWYTILFVGRDEAWNETGTAPGTSLYTVRLDGSELRRISLHPGNDRTPFLMDDGRLLFAGWRQTAGSRWKEGRVTLYGIHTDGIDYALYGGEAGDRVQHMPARGGLTVLFVEADSVGWDGAGHLSSLSARRPRYSYRRLTDDSQGLFHSPWPLRDGSFLVSHRPKDGSRPLALARFWPEDGKLETLFEIPGNHILHARPLAPRPEPDGRSSTVRPESPTGKLYCLDIYDSDPAFASIPKGSVHRLRVIEGLPPAGPSQPFGRRLLGEAPVEDDGSFHIDLPADIPVELQLLDDDGLALASCDWIWVKPREYRGCIGCHEDPERTPDNRFVEAARRPANELTLPPERRRTVTYRHDVLPVLRSRCLSCHQNGGSKLVLGTLQGDEAVERGYSALLGFVDPGRARTSPLVLRLFGRDTRRPWDGGGEVDVPQDHVDVLSADERRLFTEWIDLGAQRRPSGEGDAEPETEGSSGLLRRPEALTPNPSPGGRGEKEPFLSPSPPGRGVGVRVPDLPQGEPGGSEQEVGTVLEGGQP